MKKIKICTNNRRIASWLAMFDCWVIVRYCSVCCDPESAMSSSVGVMVMSLIFYFFNKKIGLSCFTLIDYIYIIIWIIWTRKINLLSFYLSHFAVGRTVSLFSKSGQFLSFFWIAKSGQFQLLDALSQVSRSIKRVKCYFSS